MRSNPPPLVRDAWLSAIAFTRLIPTAPDQVVGLCERSGVRILRRPGLPPRFHKGDVEALASRIITTGSVESAPV